MFETMLVAIDGSEPGREALATAIAAAERFGSEVIVLHVLGHKLTWATTVDLESQEEASALIDDAVRQLRAAGLSGRGEVVRAATDRTAEEIVRVAGDIGASVIVMGTRGLNDATSLVLGSVAHSVVHHAPCPVLLVPRGIVRANNVNTVVPG